jgi:single-strand DNA-binding protein
MNTAILTGFLGEDSELRQAGGSEVLKFRLATTQKWEKDGEEKESTQWHSVVLWGAKAAVLAPSLRKGSCVMVTGSIQYRSWDKDDGTKGYATEIRADEVGLVQLPGKSGGGGGRQAPPPAKPGPAKPGSRPGPRPGPARQPAAPAYDSNDSSDDIPF